MGTYASGLEAREIPTADKLKADVEGDIGEIDGVMRITAIRLHLQIDVPEDKREKAERLLESFSKGCPAYQSIKDCIDVRWTATLDQPVS